MTRFGDSSGTGWTIGKQSTLLQTDNDANTSSLNLYEPGALTDAFSPTPGVFSMNSVDIQLLAP